MTTLVKSLRRAILQAAEKRTYFHRCSDVCKGFVKSWEKLPTEPRRSGGEWESVYRRKKMKSEYKCHSPLFNASNKFFALISVILAIILESQTDLLLK